MLLFLQDFHFILFLFFQGGTVLFTKEKKLAVLAYENKMINMWRLFRITCLVGSKQ